MSMSNDVRGHRMGMNHHAAIFGHCMVPGSEALPGDAIGGGSIGCRTLRDRTPNAWRESYSGAQRQSWTMPPFIAFPNIIMAYGPAQRS